MELTCAPARPGPDTPSYRRATVAHASQGSPRIRGLREMTSLLIAALAGALATGVLATLIMMSAPAYASGTAEGHALGSVQLMARLPREADEADWRAARTLPEDLPDLAPRPGPQALTPPPVCTCTLPPAVD